MGLNLDGMSIAKISEYSVEKFQKKKEAFSKLTNKTNRTGGAEPGFLTVPQKTTVGGINTLPLSFKDSLLIKTGLI